MRSRAGSRIQFEGVMRTDDLVHCVKIAACVCGKDGVISETEIEKMFEFLVEHYPEVDADFFDQAVDSFFDDDPQLEDLFNLIHDDDLRRFTLQLSEISAAADGLDVRENIALSKVCEIWGVDRDA